MKQKTLISFTLSALALSCISCSTQNLLSKNPFAKKTVAEDSSSGVSGGYPIANRVLDPTTGKAVKDQYISPFKPYNPIIATGFKSGQRAGDPSTIKVDPKTGKPDNSTMKIFKLP